MMREDLVAKGNLMAETNSMTGDSTTTKHAIPLRVSCPYQRCIRMSDSSIIPKHAMDATFRVKKKVTPR
jgi:hypothetical protein